jgi:GMP synthase (glutamine-hydrolysing)
MTHHLGGKVAPAAAREYGHAEVEVVAETPLFHGLPQTLEVWMSHGDHAEAMPPGFQVVAKTANAVAGVANEARKMWGVQFHPEVAHTRQGIELLRNFVVDICGAKQDWTPAHFIETTVAKIRERRRRFERGSGAGREGDRRPAHMHLREQWCSAQRRVRAGAAHDARSA